MEYNIYCDESCHLPNDGMPFMGLGAVWCAKDKAREIAVKIREVKIKHGLPPFFEIKWNKVSPAKLDFYLDVVEYFFREEYLHFRAWTADKRILKHAEFHQSHDEWYYKMYYSLLKELLHPPDKYFIYLDIKDTQSREKINKLHDILCNFLRDFQQEIVARIQSVKSHEVEQIQLTDLLIGAVVYAHKNDFDSDAKFRIINKISDLSGYKLNSKTPLSEKKFNLYFWEGRDRD